MSGFLLDLLSYQGMRGRTLFQQDVWTEFCLIYSLSQSYCSQRAWSGKCLLPGVMLPGWINQAGFGPTVVSYH